MRASSLLRLFFILYCIEAGIFLIFAPWSPVWDQTVLQIPLEWLRALGLNPVFRGAVSGFGLIHLVWGAHDLEGLLARRRLPPPAPPPPPETAASPELREPGRLS